MLTRLASFLAVSFALISCSSTVDIASASARPAGDDEVKVEIAVSSDGARIIKDRQFYFSIVVRDCSQKEGSFPVEPYVGQAKADKFDFTVGESEVVFSGSLPRDTFRRIAHPCALLRGGGYISGNVESAIVPIKVVGF